MSSPKVFDVIRLTRKDNCGKCGFHTCMAFSMALLSGKSTPDKCPYLDQKALESIGFKSSSPRKASQDPDTALLRELKTKIANIDLAERAVDLGGEIKTIKEGTGLVLPYLGKEIIISKESIRRIDGQELEPRDQILLYNYVYFGGKGELTGNWVGMESFPNSISKVNTLKRYTELPLAQGFGNNPTLLKQRARGLGASEVEPCHADLCLKVPVLPKLPIQIHLWQEEPEEGFEARVKLLFDQRAIDFLDLESLVFAAERMSEELLKDIS